MSTQPSRERRPLGVKNVGLDAAAAALVTQTSKPSLVKPSAPQRHEDAKSPSAAASRPPASRSARLARSLMPPGIVTTPRKRAVPIEDVHCRNTIHADLDGRTAEAAMGADEEQERLMSPHKRSRSSTSSQSNTKEGQPSTGDSSIARGIDGINVSAEEASSQAATPASFATARTPSVAQFIQAAQAGPSRPSASAPSAIPRPTTTRIDKMSRMSEEERAARERHRKEQSDAWRRKFLKAFPSFRFHLDGVEESTKLDITRFVTAHGGAIEPFFSKQVTHLITGRKQPTASGGDRAPKLPPKTQPRPTGTNASTFASVRAASKGKAPSTLPSRRKATGPQHSDRNPFEELGPPTNGNDVVAKAQQLGIKVWTLDKFHTVVQQLYGERLPERAGAGKPDLKQLLREEKLHGTLERDPLTRRGDYHYFDRRNCWLLVEDATQEHQVIHAQEYKRPGHDEDPPWPRIFGELEGRCPFTRYEVDSNYRRRFKPNRYETLRRTVPTHHPYGQSRAASLSPGPVANAGSLRAVLPRGASPYALASGNSVSVASHITSTTSAAVGSSLTGQASILLDKRLSHLGRRTADIGPSRLGPGTGVTRSASLGNSSMASATAAAVANNAAAVPEPSRGAVVRKMLGLNDQVGTGFRRSASTPAIAQHEIQREKKPGYCENCRAKYEDFDEHIASRKHVKFANNDAHFVDIDQLLLRVARPRLEYFGGSTFGSTDYDGDEDRSESGFAGYDEGSVGGTDVSGFATDVAPHTGYTDDEEVVSTAATLVEVDQAGDDEEMVPIEEELEYGEDEGGEEEEDEEEDPDQAYSEYIDDDGMAGDDTGGETVDTAHTSPHTSPEASRAAERDKETEREAMTLGRERMAAPMRREKSPHPQRWAAQH